MPLLFPFARISQPQQFIAPSGPFARGLVFAAIPGDRSIAVTPAQPVVSGSSTVVVGRGGRGARAPATQIAGYVGYSSDLSIAANNDYTLAAFCIPSSGSTTGTTPTHDFIGAQTNYLSIASNGFRAKIDNNTTALNAYTKMDPALFMATRRGSTISTYVPSGAVVTAATGTRAQTFTTICAGRYSGNNHTDTETYLLLVWNRGIGLDEYLALSKNVWQIFAPHPQRLWVPSGATVFEAALSGNAATSAQGSVTPSISLAIAGNGATASAGTVSVGSTFEAALSGNSAIASAGNVSPSLSLALSGNGATASAGAVAAGLSSAVSGNAASASAGSVTPAIALSLSGNSATSSAGTVEVAGVFGAVLTGNAAASAVGSLTPSVSVAVAGASATASQGSVGAEIGKSIAGNSVSSAAGSISPSLSIAISGNSATASAGSVVPSGPIVVGLTGNGAVASAGILSVFGAIPFLPQTGIDTIVESYTKDLVYQAATKPLVFIARHHR